MISQREVDQILREKLETKSPLLDGEAQIEMTNLYDAILHFPNWEEKLGTTNFEQERTNFLANLIEIKSAPLTSAKGKVRQNLENNGLFLPDLIQLYNKHNKSEKEIIEEIRGRFSNGKGYKVRDWTLTSEEKSAFQDPIIDTQGSMRELEKLINELREVKSKINNDKNPFSHLKKLKEYQNASPNSDLGKAARALNNNGDLLNSAVNSLIKKSKESKEKILKSLSDWYYYGNIYNHKEKNSLGYQNGEGNSWGEPGNFLLEEDFQEIKQALIDNILKNVQKDPHEWRIERVCTVDGSIGGMGKENYQEHEIMLIHQSAKLEYEDDSLLIVVGRFLIKEPHKTHSEKLFSPTEFAKLKEILHVKDIKDSTAATGYRQLAKKTKTDLKQANNKKWSAGEITVLSLFAIAGVVLVTYLIKKIKQRKKTS